MKEDEQSTDIQIKVRRFVFQSKGSLLGLHSTTSGVTSPSNKREWDDVSSWVREAVAYLTVGRYGGVMQQNCW